MPNEKVKVRMPDGVIVAVAKGTPKEAILAKYEMYKQAKANSAGQLTKDIGSNIINKPVDAAKGVGDVIMGGITGAAGAMLGAAGGAVRQPLEALGLVEDRGTFSDFFNQARQSMAWEPTSETGEKLNTLISKPFEAAAEAAPGAADWMYETTDSPAAAALTKALVEGGPEAAMFALGLKGAKGRANTAAKAKNDAAIAKAEADAMAAAAKEATDMAAKKKAQAVSSKAAAKADQVQATIDRARAEQQWKRDFDNPEFQRQSDVVHQYYGNEIPWEGSPVSNVGKVVPEEVNLGDVSAVRDAMSQITKERQMEAGFQQNALNMLAEKYPDRSNAAAKRGPNTGKFGQGGAVDPGVFADAIIKAYRSVKGNKDAFTAAISSQFGNKMGKHIDTLYKYANDREAVNVTKGKEATNLLSDNAPVIDRPAGYAQSSVAADPTTSAFFDALLDPQKARKPVSNAETIQKARGMGLTETEIAKAVKKSEDMPAILVAAGDFVAAQAKEIKAAAKKAMETGAAEDFAAVGEMYQRMTSAQHLARMSSATGRALQANKILKRAVRSKADIDDLFAAMGGAKDMKAFAKAMADLPEDMIPGAIRSRKWGKKFQELYINSLLSGLMTQANAFTGTAFNLAYQVPLNYAAWAAGKLPGKGKSPDFTLSSANSFAFGALQGMKEAGQAALLALRTNEPIIKYQGKNMIPERTVSEIHGHRAIGGRTGDVVSLPSRLLLTQDSFFKSLAYAMEMNKRASIEANQRVRLGEIRPDQIPQVIAEIKRTPSKEMHDAAVAMADKVTFTAELGDFGRSVQRMINHHPAGTVIFPFIRTTTNIYKQSLKGTPLGLVAKSVREDFKAGGERRNMAAAHMLAGSVVAWNIFNMAMEDKIVGSAGVDPDRYAAHMNKYGAEYAYINDDNEAIPLRVLEPFTMIGTLAADLATIRKSIPYEEWDKLASMFTVAVTNALLNKNFTQTASDLVLGLTNPQVYGNRPLGLVNTLTTPRAVAQAERVVDPTLQNPAGKREEDLDPDANPAAIMLRRAIDQWKKEIPGMSKDLPARYDWFGRVVLKPGAIINPFHASDVKDTPQDEAVWDVRHIWTPKAVEDKVYGVELSKHQRAQYQKLTGLEYHNIVSMLISDPGFNNLPPAIRAERLKKAYSTAKKVGAGKLILSTPNVMNKLPSKFTNQIRQKYGDGKIR